MRLLTSRVRTTSSSTGRALIFESLELRMTMTATCCVTHDEINLRVALPGVIESATNASMKAAKQTAELVMPTSAVLPGDADIVFANFDEYLLAPRAADPLPPAALPPLAAIEPPDDESSVTPCSQADLTLAIIVYERRIDQLFGRLIG